MKSEEDCAACDFNRPGKTVIEDYLGHGEVNTILPK